MNYAQGKRPKSWTSQSAILVSEDGGNLGMMLREMIRSYNWKLIEQTDSLATAFDKIATGSIQMMIVNESEQVPAAWVLKKQLQHKTAMLTPSLFLCTTMNTGHDTAALDKILATESVVKPLSPERFLPAFTKVLNKWSVGPLDEIRNIAAQLAMKNDRTALTQLARMAQDPAAAAIAGPCLAVFLMENGDLKAAEKVLLGALKLSPKNLGIILSLSGFYLKTAMPGLALRILTEARNFFHNPRVLYTDLIVTHLMLNQVRETVPILIDMMKREYMPELAKSYLARVFFTEGMKYEFEEMMKGQNANFLKFTRAWSRERDDASLAG